MVFPTANQKIFINLPVSSMADAIKFYTAVGFTRNEKFSNDQGCVMALAPDSTGVGAINLSLLSTEFFKSFLKGGRQIAEWRKTSEVLLCLSAETREDVDAWVEAAKNAGGNVNVTDAPEMPNMHGGSFEDLDGHIWEVMWMDPNAH